MLIAKITNFFQIIHNLLKPKMTSEDLKHNPSAHQEPVSNLMEAGNTDSGIEEGLSKVKALLDRQFQECDAVSVDYFISIGSVFVCALDHVNARTRFLVIDINSLIYAQLGPIF